MRKRQAAALMSLPLLLGFWSAQSGCGPDRHALYLRMPDQDKELFARSRQFMTDHQQERFLALPTSDERVALIESLKIQERLARFTPYQREAILAGQVVPGMDAQAVMLAWGRPLTIERRNERGVRLQCWSYERPDDNGNIRERKVYFVNSAVTEITP